MPARVRLPDMQDRMDDDSDAVLPSLIKIETVANYLMI